MNSYRVACTGEDRADPKARLYHVDITVDGYDDEDAQHKARAYLGNVYPGHIWRADAVNQLTTKRRLTPSVRRRFKARPTGAKS